MIDRLESRQPVQPLPFPTARQSPVHLAKVEMRIWLYMSARVGQIVTGEELLDHAWDGKDRDGRRLDWNYPDRTIRDKQRHLVIGAMNTIRRSVHSDGQYIIETTYAKADGLEGYRVRETTDEDAVALMKQGYLGAYNRRMTMLAEREAIAAQPERPGLAAPQEQEAVPSHAPAQSSEERSDEHHLFSASSESDLPSSSLPVGPTEPDKSPVPVQSGDSYRSLVTEMVESLEGDNRREPLPATDDGDDAVVRQLSQVLT